jgi:HSP20 family molecular chaperone IbpA
LETKRVSIRNSDKHDLVTIIKIEKGTVHALMMQTLKIELFLLKQDSLSQNISQWRRLDEHRIGERRDGDIWVPPKPNNRSQPNNRSLNAAGTPYDERHVLAIWTPEDQRAENLAPSERTQYASYSIIEANDVYEVVVTLAGIRYRSILVRWLFELIYQFFYTFSYRPQRASSAISIPADAKKS